MRLFRIDWRSDNIMEEDKDFVQEINKVSPIWMFGRYGFGIKKRRTAMFTIFQLGFFKRTEQFDQLKTAMQENVKKLRASAGLPG